MACGVSGEAIEWVSVSVQLASSPADCLITLTIGDPSRMPHAITAQKARGDFAWRKPLRHTIKRACCRCETVTAGIFGLSFQPVQIVEALAEIALIRTTSIPVRHALEGFQ